jgi:hypothetical protein
MKFYAQIVTFSLATAISLGGGASADVTSNTDVADRPTVQVSGSFGSLADL